MLTTGNAGFRTRLHAARVGFAIWRRRHFGRPLAMMHVPKTAGTSVMEAVQQAMRPGISVRGFDACLFGAFTAWDSLGPDLRAEIYLSPAELPPLADTIMGHFSAATLLAAYPRARLVTFMREPVCRLLSHFVYWRCQTDAALAGAGQLWAAHVATARGDLAEFLANPIVAAQTDNVLVRMLLWPDADIPAGGFIDPAADQRLLACARQRLRRFGHIGLVEAEGGIFPDFGAWLGVTLPVLRLNETQDVPDTLRMDLHAALTPEVWSLLNARTRLDLALWQEHGTGLERGPPIAATIANLAARLAAGGR